MEDKFNINNFNYAMGIVFKNEADSPIINTTEAEEQISVLPKKHIMITVKDTGLLQKM